METMLVVSLLTRVCLKQYLTAFFKSKILFNQIFKKTRSTVYKKQNVFLAKCKINVSNLLICSHVNINLKS